MHIAYRRMAGPIALSCNEREWRGLWWEPRWALVRELERRGHQVDFISPLTKPSARTWTQGRLGPHHELLIIEAGPVDGPLAYDASVQTRAIVAAHKGRVVLLSDDPTRTLDWHAYAGEDAARWRCWYNTPRPVRLACQPRTIAVHDMPFAALMPLRAPQQSFRREVACLGDSPARMPAIMRLLSQDLPLAVAADADEKGALGRAWVKPPTQPNRNAWVSRYKAVMVLASSTQRRLAWRTGWALSCVAAGVPVIAEPQHAGLPWAERPPHAAATHALLHHMADAAYRTSIWAGQAHAYRAAHKIATATLDAAGL